MFSVRSCSKKGRPWEGQPPDGSWCLESHNTRGSKIASVLMGSKSSKFKISLDFINLLQEIPTSGLQKSSQRPSKKDITASIAPQVAHSWLENPGDFSGYVMICLKMSPKNASLKAKNDDKPSNLAGPSFQWKPFDYALAKGARACHMLQPGIYVWLQNLPSGPGWWFVGGSTATWCARGSISESLREKDTLCNIFWFDVILTLQKSNLDNWFSKVSYNTSSSIEIHWFWTLNFNRQVSALHISKRSGQSCCSPWALKNSGSFTAFEEEHCTRFMVIYGDLWWFMVIYGDLWWLNGIYPLVMTNIAIENDHRNSELSHQKMWCSIAMLNYQRVKSR